MVDEQEITRLINGYIDGQLDANETRNLISMLEQSEDLRDRLALGSIVERVLRAAKVKPVSGEKVLSVLREKGLVSGQNGGEDVKSRKWVLFGRRKEALDRRVKPEAPRGLGCDKPSSQQNSRLAMAVTVIVCFVTIAAALKFLKPQPDVVKPSLPEKQVPVAGSKGPQVAVRTQEINHVIQVAQMVASNVVTTSVEHKTNMVPVENHEPIIKPEDIPLPIGDGSGEPGFVPLPSGDDSAVLAKDMIPGNGLALVVVTNGMSVTSPRELPHAPLLFVKIKADKPGKWDATPNDLSSLLSEIQKRAGISYRMAIRTLNEVDADPEKNPILYTTGHYHFIYTPEQRAKLRKFMLAGGMIVFDAGLGSKPFYDSARREMRMIFPEALVQRLSLDHPFFHSYYDLANVRYCSGVREKGYNGDEPWFDGVTINCRTLAVISRWGMAIGWEGREKETYPAYRAEDALALGLNLFSYASAVRAWVKQSANATTFVDRESAQTDKVFIGQVIYDGEWKTRHAALSILLQTFNQRTAVPVKYGIKDMRLTDRRIFDAPLLYVTGHEGFRLNNEEVLQLRKYLLSGGFLFAEACCGRKGFDQAFRSEIKKVVPDARLVTLPQTCDVFSSPNRMGNISITPSLANLVGASTVMPKLEGIEIGGDFGVIYSSYGIAGSWEMSQSPYASGYNDAEALKLGQNILMYAVTH